MNRISRAIVDVDVDVDDQPWPLRAACAGNPELVDATRPPRVWVGLALCAQCPVIEQCRAWAEDETGYVGIAGGVVWTSRHRRRRSTTHTLQAAPA